MIVTDIDKKFFISFERLEVFQGNFWKMWLMIIWKVTKKTDSLEDISFEKSPSRFRVKITKESEK